MVSDHHFSWLSECDFFLTLSLALILLPDLQALHDCWCWT